LAKVFGMDRNRFVQRSDTQIIASATV